MEGWLQAVPRQEWASACLMEGTGGQNTPSFRLQVTWGLAAFGAPIWMTSIMSTWVPVLGRLSRPHQVTEGSLWAGTHWGSRLGDLRGQGHGCATPTVGSGTYLKFSGPQIPHL